MRFTQSMLAKPRKHVKIGLAGKACASSLIANIALPNGAWITNTYDNNGRMLGTWLTNSTSNIDSSVYTYNVGNKGRASPEPAKIPPLTRMTRSARSLPTRRPKSVAGQPDIMSSFATSSTPSATCIIGRTMH